MFQLWLTSVGPRSNTIVNSHIFGEHSRNAALRLLRIAFRGLSFRVEHYRAVFSSF